jgi:hypothetical protein
VAGVFILAVIDTPAGFALPGAIAAALAGARR